MIINILSVTCQTFEVIVFTFMFLGIIGKFGLFPLNLGIFGVVDGVSLFTSMVILGLNKFIYLVIISQLPLGRLGNNLINDTTFSQLVFLSSVTIYQGISLNMKGYNLRKFIAGSSMINVGMLLIIATNQDFCLTQIVLIFYLLFYNLTCTGYFALLQRQNSKCGTLLYNDVPVIQLPVLKFIFMNQILGTGGFPVFNVVLIKFYINCMVAINRCMLVLVLILTYSSLAANYSYLRIIRFISKSKILKGIGGSGCHR